MSKRTPLYQAHVDLAAKFVDFAGYSLPLHYGSLLGEHQAIRDSAGMFDVSHMSIVDIQGAPAAKWLRYLFSNDVAKLSTGRALYTCMCREDGGVIDDLIVYRLAENRFRVFINATTRDKDLAWMKAHQPADVEILEIPDNAFIAIQGPDAVRLAQNALQNLDKSMNIIQMPRFSAIESGDWFIGRTGFTGEDGIEIALPAKEAMELWKALAAQDIQPAGIGARETLRVEAGLSLYGQDIDEDHSPAESGLDHTIDIDDDDREFIGREILEDHKLFGGRTRQIGIVLDSGTVPRHGQTVERVGRAIGEITSGTFSPVRDASVAMVRVDKDFKGGCDVKVSDRLISARRAPVPFVPHGLARE